MKVYIANKKVSPQLVGMLQRTALEENRCKKALMQQTSFSLCFKIQSIYYIGMSCKRGFTFVRKLAFLFSSSFWPNVFPIYFF